MATSVTRDTLLQRREKLERELERAKAEANMLVGAIAVLKELIDQSDTPPTAE